MKLDFPKMIKDGLITLQKKEEEQTTTEQTEQQKGPRPGNLKFTPRE